MYRAGEVLDREIRVAPKLDAVVEVVKEDVVQLVTRYRRDEHHHHRDGPPQQSPAPAHDELRELHHRRIVAVSGGTRPHRQEREQGRQKGDRKHEPRADPERGERPEMAEGRHVGEVHAQKAERGGQARQEDRLEIDPQRLDDRGPLQVPGPRAPEQGAGAPLREGTGRVGLHAVEQGHEDVNAVGDRHRQHDDRRGGRGRGERETGPAAETHRGHDRQCDDEQRRERPAEPSGQQREHQRHDREACRYEGLQVELGCFHEGVVHHHQPRDPDADAGEALPDLVRETARGCDDHGAFPRLVLARQPHHHVDTADPAVAGDEACCKPGLGEGDGADPGPLGGIRADRLVHEITHHEIVAVGRGVLEVGEGIDTGRVRDLPGPLGEPGSRVEGQGRRGVPVTGDDGEEDVAGLGVRVLQCFEGEELRVVLVEVDAIVRREFEEPRTARRGRDQDQGDRDDRPSRGDDPFSEPCFDLAHHLCSSSGPALRASSRQPR